ncbi:MAG: DMT family transporter [Hyphomicrobiales bacterium]|nr:DMT family transporter [Hyphomicrobiales bacterium]
MANKTTYNMGKAEWIMLLALAVLWGSSFINLKISLQELQPFTLVFLRTSIAGLALLLWCVLSKRSLKLTLKEHIILFGMGMTSSAIPFSFFTWGQQFVNTSVASIFNGTVPFFTAIFAHFILGHSERLSANKIIGLLIGFVGILTIIGFDVITEFDVTNIAQLSLICATFFYAISGIYNRLWVSDSLNNTVISTYCLLWSGLVTGFIAIYFEGLPTLDYSHNIWLSITILSLLSTALAYVILFKLLKRAGPSNTSLSTFIIPIFAIAIGVILLGESLEVNEIIGVVLILVGVGFIQNLQKRLAKLF